MISTLTSKATSLLGQIVLAWYLVPGDYGLVALTTGVNVFAGMIHSVGLRESLILRQAEIAEWINPAFWLGLARSLLSVAMLLVAAPILVWFYHQPRLYGLFLVIAITGVFSSLSTIQTAILQAELRFHTLAMINVPLIVAGRVLVILLAWRGWGAYSLVVPNLITAALGCGVLCAVTRIRIRRTMELDRWRFLLGNSLYLFSSGTIYIGVGYGANYILGGLMTIQDVGLYAFAYGLSMQVTQFFSGELSNVLFPSLSKLQDDPKRQMRACLRATRLLAFIALPLSLLQGALADPLVHLLFQPKWYPAIPVLQILSVGMAVRIVCGPSGNLMFSQSRFRTHMVLAIPYTLAFLALVTAGALLQSVAAVALAVTICFLVMDPILYWVAIRPAGGHAVDLWRILWFPLLAGTASVILGLVLVETWAPGRVSPLFRVILLGTVSLGSYYGCARLWARDTLGELRSRLHDMFPMAFRGPEENEPRSHSGA